MGQWIEQGHLVFREQALNGAYNKHARIDFVCLSISIPQTVCLVLGTVERVGNLSASHEYVPARENYPLYLVGGHCH